MSARPEECRVPGNVWFETRQMANSNALRKWLMGLGKWHSWRCYDHFHVSPNRSNPLRSKAS